MERRRRITFSAAVVILLLARRKAVRQGVDPFQGPVPLRGRVGSSVGNSFFYFLAVGDFLRRLFLLFFFVQIVVSLVPLVANFALPWLVCNILQRCSV